MFNLISAQTSSKNVETVAELVNRYGFMAVFSIIMLLIVVMLIINSDKRNRKKQESELKILCEEREATIDQNKQMFDLVTKVQTEQVVQLQQMTSSLREMNHSVHDTETRLTEANENFEKIKESMILCDEHSKHIINTLSDILEYVKTSQACNNEILQKVSVLEKSLIINKNETK